MKIHRMNKKKKIKHYFHNNKYYLKIRKMNKKKKIK